MPLVHFNGLLFYSFYGHKLPIYAEKLAGRNILL